MSQHQKEHPPTGAVALAVGCDGILSTLRTDGGPWWCEAQIGGNWWSQESSTLLPRLGFQCTNWEGRRWWTATASSGDNIVRTLAFCRALGESLVDADPTFGTFPLQDFLGFADLLLPLQGPQFVKAAKYLTAWPMARWLRNPPPAKPSFLQSLPDNCPLPFKGRARQHFRNLLASRGSSRRAAKVMLALLQGVKRGCAPADDSFIIDAMRDHRAALTKELPALGEETRKAYEQNFRDLWARQLKPWERMVEDEDGHWIRSWKNVDPETGDVTRWRIRQLQDHRPWRRVLGAPGTHACVEARRSDGGKVAYLHNLLKRTDSAFEAGWWRDASPLCPRLNILLRTNAPRGLAYHHVLAPLGDACMEHVLSFLYRAPPPYLREPWKEEPHRDQQPYLQPQATSSGLPEWVAGRERSYAHIRAAESVQIGQETMSLPPLVGIKTVQDGIDVALAPCQLLSMSWDPVLGCQEIRGWPMPSYGTVLRAAVQNFQDESPSQLRAEVAPVLEPLKVRLISKGNALPYWAASPWQRRMWQTLRGLPEFALIGQEFDPSQLHGILDREKALGVSFPDWVSGDYAAATDGLSQEVNSLALSAALDRLGATPEEARLCRAVLGNHLLNYPHDMADQAREEAESVRARIESGELPPNHPVPSDLEPVLQKNGQLMGSPLSFPILCAINATAYKLALEEYLGRPLEWGQLPVLVNGDDIVFRADARLYEIWQRKVAEAGFTLSLGKNYISPTMLSINSQYYLVSTHGPWSQTFRQVGYLNTGLLFSETANRLGRPAQRPELQEKTWTDKVSTLLSLCNDPVRVMRRVKHYYRDVLQRDTGHGELSLWLPPQLGGLGLNPKGQGEDYLTPFQRNLCRYLREQHALLEGQEVRESAVHWDDRVGWVLPRRDPWSVRVRDRLVQVAIRAPFEPLQEGERLPEEEVAGLHPVQVPPPVNPDKRSWRFRWVSREHLLDFRSRETGSFHGSCEPWVGQYVVRPGGAN